MGKKSKGKADRRANAALDSRRRGSFAKIRSATPAFAVRIGDNDFRVIGSGAIVDSTGIIVTAKHVMDDLQRAIESSRENGDEAAGFVLIPTMPTISGGSQVSFRYEMCGPECAVSSESMDLAVLKINAQTTLVSFEVDYRSSPSEGDIVGACGFPYGLNVHEGKALLASFLQGMVSAVVPHPILPRERIAHYLLQLPVNPGNSGGPVFDMETGSLIGIVSRRFEAANIPTGLCVAEAIHKAREGIDEVRKMIKFRVPGVSESVIRPTHPGGRDEEK